VSRLWFITRGTFVCVPPKCGGTAVYRAAFDVPSTVSDRHVFTAVRNTTVFFDPDQMIRCGLRAVQAYRDPVERFKSLWRDKCRDGDDNLPWLEGLTPSELMDFIEGRPEENHHWRRQADFYRPGVELVDYRRILEVLGLPQIRANVSRPDDTPVPVERIRAHYRADFELASCVT